jgi:Protein of unknown function (DUF3500)
VKPRRRGTPITLGALVFFFVLGVALPRGASSPAPPGMAEAARAFVETLRPPLRAAAIMPFDSEERRNWHYVPRRREGVSLKELNGAERAAALALLRTGLSARGYDKATGIVELEGILRKLELFGGLRRDPGLYYLALFGKPSDDAPWGWRFEGHHLSLNFSSVTGRIVASTPAFFGANPARVPEGPRKGWRVLGREEDLARRLLASLGSRQRSQAVISSDAPSEILFGPDRDSPPAPAGLAAAEMTPAQREVLWRLLEEYVGNLRPEGAERTRERIRSVGAQNVRFAWAGGKRPGQAHYYRIQGPTFVVEYDNTQDGANHVHTVWRDLEEDFGGDLLARHYAESPHHRAARSGSGAPEPGGAGLSPPSGP